MTVVFRVPGVVLLLLAVGISGCIGDGQTPQPVQFGILDDAPDDGPPQQADAGQGGSGSSSGSSSGPSGGHPPSQGGTQDADANATGNQTAQGNHTTPEGGYNGFDGEPADCSRIAPPGPFQVDAGVATGYQTRVLDVAVAVDATFVQRHGDDWRSTVDLIMRMADEVYQRELQLEVKVVAVVPIPAANLTVVENTEATLRSDLSQAILDDTRAYFDDHHAEMDRDLVYTLVGTKTAGTIAGQAECIGGARYKDAAYGWGEAVDLDDGNLVGPVGLEAYSTVKVIIHEMAHILGAHHHYQTCGAELLLSGPGDLLGACSIMTNAVDFASFYFSPLNKMAIRGYAESVDL